MWVRVMGRKESRVHIPEDHRPQVERLGLLLRAVGSHGRDERRSSSGAMCGMDQRPGGSRSDGAGREDEG